MKLLCLLALTAALAFLPSGALAQDDDGSEEDSFVLRINGVYRLAAGDHVDTAVLINADAEIAGDVHNALVVINGDATIASNATVEGSVTIINGTLSLRAGSTVEDDVVLVRSELERAPGTVIGGDIRRRSAYFGFGTLGVLLSIYLWIAMTVIVLAAGLGFAAAGGRQLNAVATALREQTGQTIVAALITWIGLPVVAVAAFLTIVGFPLGLSVLFFLMPALAFLGYLATGSFVGTLILPGRERPYIPVLLGLLILQVVALIPVMGWLTASFASAWGAGGLVYVAWRGMRTVPAPTPASPG